MRLNGIIEYNKDDQVPCYIGIPELEIHSQGKNIIEAQDMLLDAFGELLFEHTKGKVSKRDLSIIPTSENTFDIVTNKIKEVSAFVIARLRSFSKLTQSEAAGKMGKNSTYTEISERNSALTCHICGNKRERIGLGVRHWSCEKCGSVHDRDANAAINILLAYRDDVRSGRATPIRTKGNSSDLFCCI